jgi:hypothetical protein
MAEPVSKHGDREEHEGHLDRQGHDREQDRHWAEILG